MKVIKYKNPDVTTVNTYIAQNINSGTVNIDVKDTSVFSVNDIILIEPVGNEFCEIRHIINISNNTLTLDTPLIYSHSINTDVIKLNYDKYRIKRSQSENGSYIQLIESYLDYANKHNRIIHYDRSVYASDDMYYRIYYYNSVTDTEVLAATLYNENNFSYISIDRFREETGITDDDVSDSVVMDALMSGVEWIRDNAYNIATFETTNPDTIFELDLNGMEFADWDADNEITKYDFEVYEYDKTTGVRTYLSHKLVAVIPDSYKLIFSEPVPSVGKILYIKAPVTFKKYEDIKTALATINKLIAVNYLLRNVNINKLKNGISNWSVGGTNVSRDPSSIESLIENNMKQAKDLLSQILKIYMKSSKLRTRNSILSRKGSVQGYNIRFPSGNLIN